MRRSHPDTELIAYLNDEVRGAARERIRGHLEACAECQDALEAYRRLLDDLRRSIPAPPALHSARYRAELRAKLAERREHARRWWQPASMALSAGLAAALVVILVLVPSGWLGDRNTRIQQNLTAFEEVMLGKRLDLLRQYQIVERLDLLEDFDVIGHLDHLSENREG